MRLLGLRQFYAQYERAQRRRIAANVRRSAGTEMLLLQSNDTLNVKLPFSFRTEAIDGLHPDTVALMRGPLMLVALDPQLKLNRKAITSPNGLKETPHAVQTFELMAPLEGPRFRPFYLIGEEQYTTYLEQT